ncbi:hypothetical protein [Rufibacter latericius]|uniref:Uncharacterized protein n=1 Tax=Rufibacter latericius TaxID=2487040 RepID=A0A3M9M966_9BACT|nr:hypothetical protein [Rufibacter latericius]RNI21765.1 hypothetical protein EFB08_21685 [Rufibacter latericius]
MKVVQLHTLLTDLEPLMTEVQVLAGGYFTEEQTIFCERMERLGVPSVQQAVEFYSTEKDHVIAIHYARRLDLQKSICAIDYFPEHSPKEVIKVSDKILGALKK